MSRLGLPAPSRLALAFLLLAATAARGGQSVLDARLYVVPGPAADRVVDERPGGLSLSLPAGAGAERVEPLADGWVAIGSHAGRPAVWTAGADGLRRLPDPPSAGPSGRLTPLVDDGSLAALAWLEGESQEATVVAAAAWGDGGWDERRVIAGPGTHLALVGAAAGAGEWLLAWAAFDGEDDEIVWSLGGPEGWTPPRRIADDDPWPDILPAIVPAAGGALAAWSGFDGRDYRLHVARWEDGGWSEARIVGGRGTTRPTLTRLRGEPVVLFRTVLPRGWGLARLGADGSPLDRALAPRGDEARPVLRAAPGGDELAWPRAGLPAGPERTLPVPWESAP